MLSSNLCDYSDPHILIKETIAVENTATVAAQYHVISKIIFRTCVLSTNCITSINNTQVYDTHNINVVVPMYNLIEHIDYYSKTSITLWQYSRGEPALDFINNIIEINAANATKSLATKAKIAAQTEANDRKNVERMVPLKSLSNLGRTIEISLMNRENKLDL